jgi:precorrin-6B methylase 2
MKPLNRGLAGVVGIVLVAVTTAVALTQESGPEFERQNRISDIVRFLGAQPGSLVADVGAGDGAFTIPIARAAAPNGRAVAVDISESALNTLRDRAGREDVKNVDIVVGGIDDPHLPVDRFDAVLIHNAYHEMTEHEAMLRHIRAALKRDGRFVVVEPAVAGSREKNRSRSTTSRSRSSMRSCERLVSRWLSATPRSSSSRRCPAGSGCSWPAARDGYRGLTQFRRMMAFTG